MTYGGIMPLVKLNKIQISSWNIEDVRIVANSYSHSNHISYKNPEYCQKSNILEIYLSQGAKNDTDYKLYSVNFG